MLLAGLLGAIGVTVGGSRPWASATSTQRGLPAIHVTASGADLAPLAGALGVVVLAAFGAVIATRGWVRRGLGILIAVACVVVLVATLLPGAAGGDLRSALAARGWTGGGYTSATEAWRWLVLAAAVVAGVAGAATAVYGGEWAVMGARYDAPRGARLERQVAPEELTEDEVWRAIDSGRDPTRDS